jgi:hypothetical protein
VKRLVYLLVATLVAMLILVPTAMAQTTVQEERTVSGGMMERTVEMESTQPLPKSGGVPVGPSVLLPGAALLLGVGVLGYAVLRRR